MNENNFFHKIGDLMAGNGWGRKQRQKAYFNQSATEYQIHKGEVYINTSVPYEIVNSIPEISIPIRRLASMFANGVFMLESEDGKTKNPLSPELEKLFKKPNIMQSQNEWMRQYLMQLIAYGYQYMYKNKPTNIIKIPVSLFNLNPAGCKVVLTGKTYKQVDISGIVEKFVYCEDGKEETIPVDEIIWNRIGDLNSSVIGKSLISSLQFPISNTELAYKYLNAISGEKGAIGILSNKSKDAAGVIPLQPVEQKRIENAWSGKDGYGVEDGQGKVLITQATLSWDQIGYETKKLLLLEQIDANAITIFNALGINPNVFRSSTYENLKHALKSTHNDTIVPYADQFTQSLTDGLKDGIPNGFRLILDYSHLPYLQADNETEAKTFAQVSAALNDLTTSGIITPAEAEVRLEKQFPSK